MRWISGVGIQDALRDAASVLGTRTLTVHSFDEASRFMFSVAIRGYGIVIYDDDGRWRVFSTSDALSARLATRVEFALQTVPAAADEGEAREALLAIAGAGLLSASCDHAPGECDGEGDG